MTPTRWSQWLLFLFLLEWLKTADNGDNQNEVKYCKDAGFTPRLVANGWIQLSWCLAHSSSIPSLLRLCHFVLSLVFTPGSRNSQPTNPPKPTNVPQNLPPKKTSTQLRIFFLPRPCLSCHVLSLCHGSRDFDILGHCLPAHLRDWEIWALQCLKRWVPQFVLSWGPIYVQVSLYRVWGVTQREEIVNSTWKNWNCSEDLPFSHHGFQLAFKGFVDSIQLSCMYKPYKPSFYIPTIPTCRAVRLGRPKAAARHATRPKRQGLHGLIANWDTPYEATSYCWYLWVHQIWQSCVYRCI